MHVNRVRLEYDSMFGKNSLEEIESYLVSCIEEAYEEPDYYSVITLLNEFIGFCRDTSQNEKGNIQSGVDNPRQSRSFTKNIG